MKTPKSSQRIRRVFGRRIFTVGPEKYRVEMREHGVVLWRSGSKRKREISFPDLLSMAFGQRLLL